MKRNGMVLIFFVALAALLGGCWGSSKDSSVSVGGGGNVLATATPVGLDVCHNCHANTAAGGAGIFEAWGGSRHANLDNTFDAFDNQYHGSRPSYHVGDECASCHNPTDDGANLAMYVGPGSGTTPRSVVGCEACHGGGSLHFGIGPIGGPKLGLYAVPASAGQSSQYNTCGSCHGVEAPLFHSASERHIHDTHNDNANRAIGSDIQGYVIRKSVDTACVDCHNPHSANLANSPNRQWKASRHGDFAGEGWKHYQWTAANRASCQRCHTTTGLINYLTNPATYSPANNVFSWLSSPATDNRSEMLYCYGCHTNYYGGLRDPGPITASYTGVTPEPAFPDIEGSNICMACHTGRENGDSIKAATGTFDNVGFINSHYLTAGATLFTTSGYEYDNLSYANPAIFQHDLIGRTTAPVPGTGVNGPCVGCHMTSPNGAADDVNYGKHRFLPIKKDAGGVITAVTSTNCANCHDGDPYVTITPATLEAEKELAHNALAALDNQLRARGFYFVNSHPYFFTVPAGGSANAVRDWTPASGPQTAAVGKNNMGAAFNYNLLEHDPGFYTHNKYYVRRLIYDSIDWLDDGLMNASVQDTLGALSPAFDDALTYFGDTGRL